MDTKQLANPIPKGHCRFCPAFKKKPSNAFKIVDAPGGYSIRFCTNCGVGLIIRELVAGFEIGAAIKSKNATAKIVPLNGWA